MKIADTTTNVRAGLAWSNGPGIRGALAQYGLELEDVGEYCEVGTGLIADSPNEVVFHARVTGAIAAAIILGIELERSGELRR